MPMDTSFEQPLAINRRKPVGGEGGNFAWGGTISGSVEAANDEFIEGNQISPNEWSRRRDLYNQQDGESYYGLAENRKTRELQMLITQYQRVAEVYQQLEGVSEKCYGDTFLSEEQKNSLVEPLARQFIRIRPLITMSFDDACNELKALLPSRSKIQDRITQYLEYAVMAETELAKERAQLQQLQEPVPFESDDTGEATKPVQVKF